MDKIAITLLVVGLTGGLGVTGYFYKDATMRLADVDTSRSIMADEASRLSKSVSEKNAIIATLQSENESLRGQLASTTADAVAAAEQQQSEREAIGKFVTEVQKVQSTDPELLKKYSKNYFLNENYKPASLATIPSKWQTSKKSPIEYLGPALPFLTRMFESAEADGIDLRVVSGFRSFEDQKDLKSSYKSTFGTGANKFSADQGYSEHQLGTTVDLSTKQLDTSYVSIASTKAYEWLNANAYKYGFILSYPKGNAYYMYEPWHWRFVGISLATNLHDRGIHFYEMDQREIDKYVGQLFDRF